MRAFGKICRPWTVADLEFVESNYKTMRDAEIGARIGRTRGAVRRMRSLRDWIRVVPPQPAGVRMVFDVPAFFADFEAKCRARGVTTARACLCAGLSAPIAALMRSGRSTTPSAATVLSMSLWAGLDAMDYLVQVVHA